MTNVKLLFLALSVAKELLKYLREHKKCSHDEQALKLKSMKEEIQVAMLDGTDLSLKV